MTRPRIPEITVITFNNRAEALMLAQDCVNDCVVVGCVNNRVTLVGGRQPQVRKELGDQPCCWMVVDSTLLEQLSSLLKESS